MKVIANCPCCSSPMLHHLRHNREYWFCRNCWQEMPVFSLEQKEDRFTVNNIINLSTNLARLAKKVSI